MEGTSSTTSKGDGSPVKHKSMEGNDTDAQKPAVKAKKSKLDKSRRTSILRDRRSSRGGFTVENDTDLGDIIPMDIPEENRLQIVLQHALKIALKSAFSGLPDNDVASAVTSRVTASFDAVKDEMFSLEKLRELVNPVKIDAKEATEVENVATEVNPEFEEAYDKSKAYVESLKKESENWDKLKEQLQAEKVSKKEATPQTIEVVSKSDEQKGFQERMQSYAMLHEKLDKSQAELFLQMKTIASAAISLKQLEERAKDHLDNSTQKLCAATVGETDVKDLLRDIVM